MANARLARHNAPLRHLIGVQFEWEPRIRAVEGLRKPDLVAIMVRLTLDIDAHIDAAITSKPGVEEVGHYPIIIIREIW